MSRIRSRFRDAVMHGTLQAWLMSAAMTLGLMNWGLTARKDYGRKQIEKVELKLRELPNDRALLSEELQTIHDLLRPVKYPLNGDTWWLGYSGLAGSCLMVVAVCLVPWQQRLKDRAADKGRG